MDNAVMKCLVKTWCENTEETEEYLRYNGYKNAKRRTGTDIYECDCIGNDLADVKVVE